MEWWRVGFGFCGFETEKKRHCWWWWRKRKRGFSEIQLLLFRFAEEKKCFFFICRSIFRFCYWFWLLGLGEFMRFCFCDGD